MQFPPSLLMLYVLLVVISKHGLFFNNLKVSFFNLKLLLWISSIESVFFMQKVFSNYKFWRLKPFSVPSLIVLSTFISRILWLIRLLFILMNTPSASLDRFNFAFVQTYKSNKTNAFFACYFLLYNFFYGQALMRIIN